MKKINKITLLRHKLIQYGGAELVFFKELEYLKANGFDVNATVVEVTDDMEQRLKELDINYVILGSWTIFHEIFNLRNFIQEYKPDLVIAHENGHIHLFLAKILSSHKFLSFLHAYGTFIWLTGSRLNNSILLRKRIKSVFAMNSNHTLFHPTAHKQRINFLRRIKTELHSVLNYFSVRNFTQIITCSETTAKEINTMYKIQPEIILGGVDVEYFSLEDRTKALDDLGFEHNDRLIITINRLSSTKRVDLLIRSFASISKNFEKIKLVIIGTGPELENLKNITKEEEMEDCISFTGYVTDEKLRKFYTASEIVAYPAWCNWGLVPLEALSCNRKVVIAEDALVQEALRGVEGVIVSSPDKDNFSDALVSALSIGEIETRDIIKKKFDWTIFFGTCLALANRSGIEDN